MNREQRQLLALGVWACFGLALATMGERRILFAVHYPMASARTTADWFGAVDLPRANKEKFAHRNAEKLLGIGPF